jgi:hypothetical protein
MRHLARWLTVVLIASPAFAFAPVSAGAATSPTLTVTPHDGLTDGQTVTVTGHGFAPGTIAYGECLTDPRITGTTLPDIPTLFDDCNQIGTTNVSDAGDFTVTPPVSKIFTPLSGPAIDCGTTPGRCSVIAGYFGAQVFTQAPISFGLPTPPTILSCLRPGWRHFADARGRPFPNVFACVVWAFLHHRPLG